jgi:hypothetical protein
MDSKESVAFRSAKERSGVWTVVGPDEWHLFDQPEDCWEPRYDEVPVDDQHKLVVCMGESPYPRLWIRVCHKDSPKEHPPRRETSIPRTCGAGGGLAPSEGAASQWFTPHDVGALSALVRNGRVHDQPHWQTPPSWLAGVLSYDWGNERTGRNRMVALRRLLRAQLAKPRIDEIMDRVAEDLKVSHEWWSKPKEQPPSKSGRRPQTKGRGRGKASRERKVGQSQQPRHAHETGYSGYAYRRPKLPPPEPWHLQVAPREDGPSGAGECDSDVRRLSNGTTAPTLSRIDRARGADKAMQGYSDYEVSVLRLLVWPRLSLSDKKLRSNIKAMTSLPLRWIAWQLLNQIRANRAAGTPATDGCSALLRDLLRRELGHDAASAFLRRVHESISLPIDFEDLGEDDNDSDLQGVKRGQSAWGSSAVMPGACLWPSMPPAALGA